jgi:hypothetical protein
MDEQTQQRSDSSGGEDALRELAVRLLTFHHSLLVAGQQVQEPQLLVGQLPPDLPVELPLPEGSRLLGSLAVENPMIAIETQLAGEDAVAFYRERLTAAGWIAQEEQFGPMQGGFVQSSRSDHSMATFFTSDDRFMLMVMSAPAPGGRTTVQLTLQGEATEFRPRMRPNRPDFMVVLPPIHGPKGAMQMPGGGGAGPDHVDTSATLESDLDLAAVSAHYLGELAHVGWQQLDAGASGPVAWSTWSFTDQDSAAWQALLLILQRPGRHGEYALGNYALTLRAERERDAPQSGSVHSVVRSSVVGSSWSSYGTLIGTQAHAIDEAPRPAPEPPEPKE